MLRNWFHFVMGQNKPLVAGAPAHMSQQRSYQLITTLPPPLFLPMSTDYWSSFVQF